MANEKVPLDLSKLRANTKYQLCITKSIILEHALKEHFYFSEYIFQFGGYIIDLKDLEMTIDEYMLFVDSKNLNTVVMVNCAIKFLDSFYVPADILLKSLNPVEKLVL